MVAQAPVSLLYRLRVVSCRQGQSLILSASRPKAAIRAALEAHSARLKGASYSHWGFLSFTAFWCNRTDRYRLLADLEVSLLEVE